VERDLKPTRPRIPKPCTAGWSMTFNSVEGRVVRPAHRYGASWTLKLFSPYTILSISLFSSLRRCLHYITSSHLKHVNLVMMFAKTIFSFCSVAGFLLGATNALQTVTSPSGVEYNCPEIETIEVAYAGSCKLPRLVATGYELS
jgi:hypothetical protein